MKLELEFLGACDEVGKSAILLKHGEKSVLLDYGVKLQPEPVKFPPLVKADFVIPTHAHLDHSGAIPTLFKGKILPRVFATSVTLDLMELLLLDFMKVARLRGHPQKFTKSEVDRLFLNSFVIDYGQKIRINDCTLRFYDAGHIPGSTCVLLECHGKTIFYTGDIKLLSQRLVSGAKLPRRSVDVLIMECTYWNREHPAREIEEKRLKNEIDLTLNQDETVLIPSFAVARAQEMLLILKDYLDYLAIDGMAKKASEIMLRKKNRKYVKNAGELARIYRRVKKIKRANQRKKILKRPHIIIASSGMLNGGPSVYYLKRIRNRRSALLAFVGFQVEDTPGRQVLETGVYRSETEEFEVNCRIQRFDFSSHAGRSELLRLISMLQPSLVVCVHGEKLRNFARELEMEFKLDAIVPKEGDVLEL